MRRYRVLAVMAATIMLFATCACSAKSEEQAKQEISKEAMILEIQEYIARKTLEEKGVAAQVMIAKAPNGPWIGKAQATYQLLQVIDPEAYEMSESCYKIIGYSDNKSFDELIRAAYEKVLEEKSA